MPYSICTTLPVVCVESPEKESIADFTAKKKTLLSTMDFQTVHKENELDYKMSPVCNMFGVSTGRFSKRPFLSPTYVQRDRKIANL